MSYTQINGCVNEFGLEIAESFHNEVGMGRPPLGMKPTTVRLSVDTIRRIKALVGNRRVAVFIREAVERITAARDTPASPRIAVGAMVIFPSLVTWPEGRSADNCSPAWPLLSGSLYCCAVVRVVAWRKFRPFFYKRGSAILLRWPDRISRTFLTLRSSLKHCLGVLGRSLAGLLIKTFRLGALRMIGSRPCRSRIRKWTFSKHGLAIYSMNYSGRNDDLTRRLC
jgi:hypothetical protein